MKYDLSRSDEVDRARAELERLINRVVIVDIKRVVPRRSLPQNAYLHLLLSAFGLHFGYTVAEAKLIYKDLNSELYKYDKRGRTFYRSSADLTKDEMTKSIDTLRLWSNKAGYPLPLATDQGWLREIERAVEQAQQYL